MLQLFQMLLGYDFPEKSNESNKNMKYGQG